MIALKGILVLFFMVFCCIAESATVTVDNNQPYYRNVHISGVIKKSDVNKVRDALRIPTSGIVIDSEGGDLKAALEIGDLIYRASYRERYTFLTSNKSIPFDSAPSISVGSKSGEAICASACIFIFASAKTRKVICVPLWCDKFIIHNPYVNNTSSTYDEIRNGIKVLEAKAKSQFKRVGVSEQLWDLMANTPSEMPRLLSEEEINRFGVVGQDPIYSDYMNGVKARGYGLPKSEYITRINQAKLCVDRESARRGVYRSSSTSDLVKSLTEVELLCYKENGLH